MSEQTKHTPILPQDFMVSCGCKLRFDNDGLLRWEQCNLHHTASELLKACEWALPLVVRWFNEKPHCQDHSGLTALREAIAKAKGEA